MSYVLRRFTDTANIDGGATGSTAALDCGNLSDKWVWFELTSGSLTLEFSPDGSSVWWPGPIRNTAGKHSVEAPERASKVRLTATAAGAVDIVAASGVYLTGDDKG